MRSPIADDGAGPPQERVLLARAYLSRVCEGGSVGIWRAVAEHGPVPVAEAIRGGELPAGVPAAVLARSAQADAGADLEAAERAGVRLLVPESAQWPHIAMGALERAARRRLPSWRSDPGELLGGEPVPPVALWVRGPADPAALALRSVAVVGSRAATPYGEQVAKNLAYSLSLEEFEVISGGAFGIDAAAHRGALAAGGTTVLVSARGLDAPYPAAHARLFDEIADSGLLLSEAPPGAKPHRHRFLTRNRLIAALGTGTVVVEAARRSGALNTARHARDLERPVMAVPGPVTSALSVGCHRLIAAQDRPAQLVAGAADVLALIGSAGDLPPTDPDPAADGLERDGDRFDAVAGRVYDALPARGSATDQELSFVAGVPLAQVRDAVQRLRAFGVVVATPEGFGRCER